MSLNKLVEVLKGGPGSGHRGHAGRPGQRGGSGGGKGGGSSSGGIRGVNSRVDTISTLQDHAKTIGIPASVVADYVGDFESSGNRSWWKKANLLDDFDMYAEDYLNA